MNVTLSSAQIARCEAFGREVVEFYASGKNPISQAVSYRGAETNPTLIAQSRMAEWALCKHLGVDPATLEWHMQLGKPFDLVKHSCRIDVKHTAYRNGRLVWPIKKPLISAECDALFLVRGVPPTFDLAGWVRRDDFLARRKFADQGDRLDRGTPYMDAVDMYRVTTFDETWEFDPY